MRIALRLIANVSLVLGALAGYDAGTPAAAIWCANYSNGSTNCGFHTFDQCRATVSGAGGFCTGSDSGRSAEQPAARKIRKAEPKPKRKEQEREAPAERRAPPPAAAQPAPAPPVAAQPPAAAASSFQSARALIAAGRYEDGIAAMKALGYNDHPDVAGMIGFANAKLGRLDEARSWFQRALAADPNHLSTLFSSGALYAMRGDAEKARGELARIRSVCGNSTCQEYQQLERLIVAKTR